MKKLSYPILKMTIGSLLFVSIALATQAQKLPGIQAAGILAPKDLKIDGKPAEWPQFQAYNNAIECFYTISNDAGNLYLVVQATDHSIIAKIVAGGITFTLRSTDKKSSATPVAITYPLVPPMYSQGTSYTLRTNKTFSDNALSTLNMQISGHIKEIPITGAKGIADSAISIYNDYGIKAAGLVDYQKAYTCEMAIPLKYIEQVFDSSGSFKYRIQVNGLDTSGKDGTIVVGGHSTDPSAEAVSHNAMNFLLAPTYLQGTYTIVK